MADHRSGSEPEQDLRFAVVLNGGVSLAVWMGGAVHEIDRLTRRAGPGYDSLLDHLSIRSARADVITGSSAGGINGALLALAQVNRKSPSLSLLRDLWAEQGDIEQLLTPPFTGQPTSLLQGDAYFLPRMQEAFRRTAAEWEEHTPEDRPIDLTITTSLLRGVPVETVDGLGERLEQTVHEARFEFRRGPTAETSTSDAPDPFDDANIGYTVEQLALASRSTASFPVAFEPSFIPVAGRAQAPDDRPDMSDVVSWRSPRDRQASYADQGVWQEQPGGTVRDTSRYGVDGGLLVNTPTQAALKAIDQMPAETDVRRLLLLIYPHAPKPGHDQPDRLSEPPTAAAAAMGLLAARGSQSSRTFVEEIEEHNRRAGAVRGTRSDVLTTLAGPGNDHRPVAALFRLAEELQPHYWDLRIRRSARDLVNRFPPVPGLTWAQLRAVIERAQREYSDHAGSPGARWLPYVPYEWRWWSPANGEHEVEWAPADSETWGETRAGWGWGMGVVDRVANAVLELVQKMAKVAGPASSEVVKSLREELHECRHQIRLCRAELDASLDAAMETEVGAGRGIRPQRGATVGYWRARLEGYAGHMTGGSPRSGAKAAVPEIGNKVRLTATRVAGIAAAASSLLASRAVDPGHDAVIAAWEKLLSQPRLEGEPIDESVRLLGRLVAFEVVTACIGEEPGETDSPITLVQLSLHAQNGFAVTSTDPDAKVGGYSLARFSGFLKRSWRVNDWIWGRMDAAGILARAICEPTRINRLLEIRSPATFARDRHAVANAWLEELTVELFGVPSSELPVPLAAARLKAHDELCACVDEPERATGTLRALADYVAWAVHADVILEELPSLVRSVQYDQNKGASPRSNGALFLESNQRLLDEVEKAADLPAGARLELSLRALKAFDEAGIGREDLSREGSSDQIVSTTAAAAAAGVTVLDSPRLGVGAARPVTKVIRGAFMLPYWMVVGLARGSGMARWLAVLALATGGAAVALTLLAGGPAWLTALGAGVLLTALGYGALRSGSMLHGLVLLSPVIPLMVLAGHRLSTDEARTPAVATLLLIAAMVGGLMLLGLLPHPVRTPAALAIDLAHHIGSALHLPESWRRNRDWFAVAVWAAILVVVVGLAWLAGTFRDDVADAVGDWWDELKRAGDTEMALWLTAVLGVSSVAGVLLAWFGGRMFRRYEPAVPRDVAPVAGGWVLRGATHPAATTAGWAWVYGTAYALVAVLVANAAWQTWWGRWVTVSAAVIAVVLLLVTTWTPWRARRRVEKALLAWVPADVTDSVERERRLRSAIERRGDRYDFLLVPNERELRLSARARRLAAPRNA